MLSHRIWFYSDISCNPPVFSLSRYGLRPRLLMLLSKPSPPLYVDYCSPFSRLPTRRNKQRQFPYVLFSFCPYELRQYLNSQHKDIIYHYIYSCKISDSSKPSLSVHRGQDANFGSKSTYREIEAHKRIQVALHARCCRYIPSRIRFSAIHLKAVRRAEIPHYLIYVRNQCARRWSDVFYENDYCADRLTHEPPCPRGVCHT